ncbi:MAG: ATP-binding protein [Candidatus Rokuibacteriota bacterium]
MRDTDSPHNPTVADDCLRGGGEMGALMRSLDWSQTPLGPASRWPQSLRSAVSILLPSKAQIVLFWGPDLIALYNDAYRPVFGAKHPWALGQPARECWREVWGVLRPLFEGVMRTGEAFWAQDHPFYLERHRYSEETYFDVSYDPVRDETGCVGGVFCIVSETTGRVLGERRLRTLRELGAGTALKSDDEVCHQAAAVLAQNPADVPFALLFLLEESGRVARLVDVAGVPRQAVEAAKEVDLNSATPAAVALRMGIAAETPSDAFVAASPPTASPERVLVLPLLSGVQPAGFLVAGVSRHLALSGHYRDFFDLVADRVSTAIAGVRAYDEERRRAEALAELDRAKTAFFSNVSHEFRTPLTLLLGPLEELLEPGRLSGGEREVVELAHRNGLRLLRLVNTLLDFSRIEAGRVEAVYEPTDLAHSTAELASVFRSAVERAGLRLVVDCPPLPHPTYVDREMWEKIVLNLLSNAFKFTFAGEITVTLRAQEGHAILEVRDTGIGIAPAELPNVFQRFHRVRGARSRTHEGTGIGLALVQELVRLHGGTIEVQSEVDRGTSFTVGIPFGRAHLAAKRIGAKRTLSSTALGAVPFVEKVLRWLPAEATPTPSDAAPPVGTISTHGARVLVADDNADMREYVTRLLSAYWVVDAVPEGVAALTRAREHPPDLVLADVMMPGLDGFQLLRALRDDPALRTVPVVLLSARAGEESRVEGLEAGADDYLVKPFSSRELIARVNAHLQMARLRDEAARATEAARAEAEAANRLKDEFLAVLSHELRTPLTAILGWARMLRTSSADASMVQRGLEIIERNGRLQTRLIEDLLDVSRIVSGKLTLERKPVDPRPVIESAIEAIRPTAEVREVQIDFPTCLTAGAVSGDAARLQQVVGNLLSNAVKFSPTGGHVEVRLERAGDAVRISVTDKGEGIRPEILPHIFDRFWQGERGTTRRHSGLGLGLAIARQLTELHGGTIRAESAGEKKGATFTITLPLMHRGSPPVHRERDDGASQLASLAGIRILVVDAMPDARDVLATILRQRGADVAAVGSVNEALEVLTAAPCDVLIADIAMPGDDGYQLIRRIRGLGAGRSQISAVAVTAHAGHADRARALAAGYTQHVTKPVDPAELCRVVAHLTGRGSREP